MVRDGKAVDPAGIGGPRDVDEVERIAEGERGEELHTRALWRGGMVEHHGRFYDFDRLQMSPAPTAPVPIYVGGVSAPALRRAARLGDGWISVLHSAAEIVDFSARLRALRADYGRLHESFDVCVSCSDAFDIDGYRRLEDGGVSSILTVPWVFYGGDPTSLDDKRRGLERFADEVLAKMGRNPAE